MNESTVLQDKLLNEIITGKIPVTMFLVNGFQIRGRLLGYDASVVVIEAENRHQMVYKHAISTISPIRMLNALKEDNTKYLPE